ncbi:MAG: hypothetical protein LKG27_03820 [Clostridiaceae bacterium]|jgi:hypothetical protein|nr:hypothetical protein [Clostridiaceae bacterium]
MANLIRTSLKTTNDSIILTIPLVFFMWIIGAYVGYTQYTANSLPEIILAVITVLFMLGAFLSGWFYMVKKAVLLSKKVFVMDEDRAKAVLGLFKTIPTGIGKYFLSYIGMSFLIIVIFLVFAVVIYNIGILLIGHLDLNALQMKQAMSSPNDMKTFLDSLSEAQLLKMSYWNVLFMAGSAIASFFTFLWVPEIIFSTKNPFVALFKSIYKILKKPLKTFGLFLFIGLMNIVLSFISTFAIYNPISYLIMMLIYFYFLVFIVVLLFTYYDREYVEETEPANTEETKKEDENKSEEK